MGLHSPVYSLPSAVLVVLGLTIGLRSFAANARTPGLLAEYFAATGAAVDTTVAAGVSLHVAAGEAATPFLPPGKFRAVWSGAIHAELRGTFRFRAHLRGAFKVEINGTNVLDVAEAGGASALTQPVRLNKGSNGFRAEFRSPADGNAFVRLSWTDRGTNTSPIPSAAFSPAANQSLEQSTRLRLGRELFLEHRCIRCHADVELARGGVPELAMDAPSLDGIGARRHFDWMARWILDPQSLRPSATMPKLLAGPTAQEDATAVAAYLASLKSSGDVMLAETRYRTRQIQAKDDSKPAKPLYERLHCAGCHDPPGTAQPDPAKISHRALAEKFPPGRLAEHLRSPEAHFAWTRMPNFHLSIAEARELEEWLLKPTARIEPKPAPTDSALIEKGKRLVQTTGCLNCHALKLENQFQMRTLGELASRHRKDRLAVPERDCLGARPFADCGFNEREKTALEEFTRIGLASLARHVPAEFAERQTRLLNCAACHGHLDGFPPLDLLGSKLKPEWMAKFMGGLVPHKMRFDAHPTGQTWLEARMPAFPSRAAALAAGLAAQAGFAAPSPDESPVDAALAREGHKLVGKTGLSCTQCHAVGSLLAMDAFDGEGINLAWSADRLQPEFFRRWLRAPLSVDPRTKMPAFFEGGRSPITDVLDGDAEGQINAIWEYLRQREKMLLPRATAE